MFVFGWFWCVLVGFGWFSLVLLGFAWFWFVLYCGALFCLVCVLFGCDWLCLLLVVSWLVLVGFGWFWFVLFGFDRRVCGASSPLGLLVGFV